VGLRVDKPYAQQRFVLDGTIRANRYDNYPLLDGNALDYRAAWNWRLGSRIGGVLSANRTQSLVNYSDFGDTSQRNVRTSEMQLLSADGLIFGGWHAIGSLLRQTTKNSVQIQAEGSYEAAGTELGMRYVAPSGTSLSVVLRSLDGKYIGRVPDPVNVLDDGFQRRNAEAVAAWALGGRTDATLRLGRTDYRSNHLSQRNFAGNVLSAAVRWTPTAKLAFGIDAGTDLQPYQDSFASYRVDRRLSVGPSWELGARTALRRPGRPVTTASTRRNSLSTGNCCATSCSTAAWSSSGAVPRIQASSIARR
jgi:hypothetical protein